MLVGTLLIVAALTQSPVPLSAPRFPQEMESNLYKVEDIQVYDGDTITATVQLGFQVALTQQAIRLAGFDAWEISRTRQTVEVTDEEIEKGKKAKAYLSELIGKNPDKVFLRPVGSGRGAYGRLQGELMIYGSYGRAEVASLMKLNGHDRGPALEE